MRAEKPQILKDRASRPQRLKRASLRTPQHEVRAEKPLILKDRASRPQNHERADRRAEVEVHVDEVRELAEREVELACCCFCEYL